MKKTITAVLSVVMILSVLFCFAGCGSNPKKQEAIDSFNALVIDFDEVATLINQNAGMVDDELVSTFREMSSLLNEYKGILEGDAEVSDEKYDEMIKWFDSAKSWVGEAKTAIEDMIGPEK